MHVGKKRVCFLTSPPAWCSPTTENLFVFVCLLTHLWATWSRVWQYAGSGCLLGYDRWPHRSPESLSRWPSTACHLERRGTQSRERSNKEEKWRQRGEKKKKVRKVKLSQKDFKKKHIEPLRDSFSSAARYTNMFQMENEWITQTEETLWWTTNRLYTHLNMLHVCNCSLSQTHFKSINKHWKPAFTHIHTHTHRVLERHRNPQLRARTYARTTSMTSACLGYNHSGNSNYIIERIAAGATLLITQCFQAALLHINRSS